MASTTPIKLAVLDDYHNIVAKYFSHIDPSKLEVTVFNDTLPQYSHPETSDADRKALVERLKPFSVLSTLRERTIFTGDLLRQLPNLKIILGMGGRFASWDTETMKELGIQVYGVPGKGRTDGKGSKSDPALPVQKGGGGHATTQHVWALILALARNIAADDAVVKGKGVQPGWQTGLAVSLTGKTLGVVGFGLIGAHVARIALAFGMRVVCWSANLTQERADNMAKEAGLPIIGGGAAPDGEHTFKAVSKEELFRSADVITLHYVLSERTRGLVGATELGWMKPTGLLVNSARAPLIDQAALLDTLTNGRIRGAALDVFDIEPLPANSPWRTEDWDAKGKSRVLLTPHMGYVEENRFQIWFEETAENVERLVDGRELLHRVKL